MPVTVTAHPTVDESQIFEAADQAQGRALSRLTSLWMAWEHWRLQGADSMSTWWIHHFDPHMNVLLSRDAGPFARCTPTQHRDGEPLVCTPVPPEILQLSAFSDQAAGP